MSVSIIQPIIKVVIVVISIRLMRMRALPNCHLWTSIAFNVMRGFATINISIVTAFQNSLKLIMLISCCQHTCLSGSFARILGKTVYKVQHDDVTIPFNIP
jgi:hypothetical protein